MFNVTTTLTFFRTFQLSPCALILLFLLHLFLFFLFLFLLFLLSSFRVLKRFFVNDKEEVNNEEVNTT